MITFAQPLVSAETAEAIRAETTASYANKTIVSGIKPCQKSIAAGGSGKVFIMSADTSPMDVISHLPVFAEKNRVPYAFVPSAEFINGFTCVMLPIAAGNSNIERVLAAAKKYE
ncbi:H/ACA ribonucleoprotein complex subunit 2 [Pancytospora philotis]|nr:H/ACA ribonucleoprotein complex subunit 2 [Pancytospora philotis]